MEEIKTTYVNHKTFQNLLIIKKDDHLTTKNFLPRIRFRSADCVQRDRKIAYIVLRSADPNIFQETAGRSLLNK